MRRTHQEKERLAATLGIRELADLHDAADQLEEAQEALADAQQALAEVTRARHVLVQAVHELARRVEAKGHADSARLLREFAAAPEHVAEFEAALDAARKPTNGSTEPSIR